MNNLLDGYKVVKELAKGGYSKVYHVQETNPPYRDFALKFFSDSADYDVFINEIRVLHRFRCVPNVQKFFLSSEKKDQLIILSEYISGGTLKQKIMDSKVLSEDEVYKVLDSIIQILSCINAEGYIHLDIKPSNILIGNSEYILCDWGGADIISTNQTENIKTDLNYAPPELFFGHNYVNSDIYSLGITLYFMLVGRLPFNTGKKPDTYKMLVQCNCEIDFPEHISKNMKYLISMMTQKDHSKRFKLEDVKKFIKEKNFKKTNVTKDKNCSSIDENLTEKEYMIMAANQNIPNAQYKLASHYKDEENDIDKAVEWFTKAADHGYAKAQYSLAIIYEKEDSNTSLDLAKKLYIKAAKNGHKKAQNNLAILYEKNREFEDAMFWYKQSADNGNKNALYNLGLAYQKGIGNINQDMDKALSLFQKAADLGHDKARKIIKK